MLLSFFVCQTCFQNYIFGLGLHVSKHWQYGWLTFGPCGILKTCTNSQRQAFCSRKYSNQYKSTSLCHRVSYCLFVLMLCSWNVLDTIRPPFSVSPTTIVSCSNLFLLERKDNFVRKVDGTSPQLNSIASPYRSDSVQPPLRWKTVAGSLNCRQKLVRSVWRMLTMKISQWDRTISLYFRMECIVVEWRGRRRKLLGCFGVGTGPLFVCCTASSFCFAIDGARFVFEESIVCQKLYHPRIDWWGNSRESSLHLSELSFMRCVEKELCLWKHRNRALLVLSAIEVQDYTRKSSVDFCK